MKNRIKKYHILHSKLQNMSSEELIKIFNLGIKPELKNNSIGKIDGINIFIKKIPCTTLEFNNMFDTSNLFNLPTYYNYPIGSAGINCFRELLTHIKTTKWVLDGLIDNFVMMYHFRIIKKDNITLDQTKIDKTIRKWNNNPNIKNYLEQRQKAPYEILIVLEYFPNVLKNWIQLDYKNIYSYEKQIYPILSFMNKNHLIHFDSHSRNILVSNDGIIYLTDFGLALDLDFDLNENEKKFFKANSNFDYGLGLLNILDLLFSKTIETKDIQNQKYLIDNFNLVFDNISIIQNIKILFKYLEPICKYLNIPNKYQNQVKKYAKLSLLMEKFFIDLQKSVKKENILFPNKKIKKLIKI